MVKKTINNTIRVYLIIILLSLSACIAQKEEPQPPTQTINAIEIIDAAQTSPEQKTKRVIDFKELILEHGSEEAALNYIMTLEMVVLDFYTDWCPPCRRLAPIFASIAQQITPVTFVKINAETFRSISQKFSIRAYPTLICFRNGTKISAIKITFNESELIADIKRIFSLT